MAGGKTNDSKKKILFLIHTLQVGGAERVLVNLVNSMDPQKYDITVMTVVNTGALRKELKSSIRCKTIINLKFLQSLKSKKEQKTKVKKAGNLLDGAGRTKKAIAKIYQFLWRHVNCAKIYRKHIDDAYDIEIAFLEGIATKLIGSSNNKKSKKIAWMHTDLTKEQKSEKFYKNRKEEKRIYENFNSIVCVSENVRDRIVEELNINEKKTTIKYNPIDSNKIKKLSEENSAECKGSEFTLCAIGRLSPEKAFDRLINSVYKLKKEGINVELWIIGVGPEEQKLKAMINEYGLDSVKLMGYQSNPYKYMKAADLFVCSSIAEGFSTVVSEAVILGKPIVTTDCSGMKEILGKSVYGLICDNDEKSLYEGIREMVIDENMYQKYQLSVRARGAFFNMESSIKQIEELFR